MNAPIAVIIVNWNSWNDLARCLDALNRQSLAFSRILLIDNHSNEPIPDSLIGYCKLNKIEVLDLPSNLGFAKANNIGIELVSDCEWVALVNPDAFLDPMWHECIQTSIARYPDAAGFSSALVMENERTRWDGLGDIYHMSGLVWRNKHGHEVNFKEIEEREIFSPCAAAAVYRRQALIEAGGFDEDYFCYVEDVDLGFRLRLLGHTFIFIPRAIAYHVGSASTGDKHSNFAVYHGHRNLVWTFVKDMPGVLFWLLLPMHILMNLVVLARFSISGKGGVIFKAKWDAIRGLSRIFRKRQVVQRHRRCSVGEIWRMLDKRFFIRR